MSINIANALLKVDVESHLCATRVEGSLKSKLNTRVNYLFLDKKRSFDLSAVFRLKKYIIQHKIDIIHAHSSSYFIASIVKILYPKVKIVWHDHYGNSEQLKSRRKQPLKYFSKLFLAIISVNALLEKWSKENLTTSRVIFVPNFASLSDVSKKTKLKGIEGKRIVCVAGFRPQKDHLNLLRAFKIVQNKYQDWTLHLVGNHYNDTYYQSVKSYIELNDLSNKVFMYHNVIDIRNILSQSSIGVLSSISEGLPVSLLEYGLAKLPVVVTNVGECNEVLESGKYGLLVSPSNEEGFSISLNKLIADCDLRNQYSNQLHKHISENYSEEKIIHKLLKIYKF
ncbi:MAG: glycosyltransferase family 4 protein [Flavobacteriaceae bacterium]|nr:glycosyltransferase family 4 protein [Flavobacteriaceae bacterium]